MLTFTGGEGLAERMKSLNFLPIVESEIIRGIRSNTEKGVDASGSTFPKYSKQYEEYGRLKKGLRAFPPNLRRRTEDSLLDTLGVTRIDEKSSEISVKEDREQIAEGLSRKYKFMGVSPNVVTLIEKKLEDEFVRMVQ